MIEEPFASGGSFIHRLNPAVRVVCALFLSLTTALSDDITIIVSGYLPMAVILIWIAGLKPRDVMKRLKPLFWFLLMIWVFLPLTFGGESVYQYHWIDLSAQGVMLCCKITLKSITILLFFSGLIATMTIASLGNALHKLRVPDKMVFLLLMSYRYISVIEQEYTRLLRAARFRGFQPGTNLHSYKTFGFLAGMLFVRASLRAQRVYQAMVCRGFRQKFHTLDVYPRSRVSYWFLICIVTAGTSLVVTEIIWALS